MERKGVKTVSRALLPPPPPTHTPNPHATHQGPAEDVDQSRYVQDVHRFNRVVSLSKMDADNRLRQRLHVRRQSVESNAGSNGNSELTPPPSPAAGRWRLAVKANTFKSALITHKWYQVVETATTLQNLRQRLARERTLMATDPPPPSSSDA